jgi:hypothetical protein
MSNETKPGFIAEISVAVIIILVINLVLVAAGSISMRTFWFIILLAAMVAYFVIPKLKRK